MRSLLASLTLGTRTVPDRRLFWPLLTIVTLLGLALRVAAAQGGLWLDEAWSATLAHDVGTPGGVLFGINHDNNHHLNSLWLQFVGLSASTWLMRLPAIVTGTLAVPVAACLAAPRGSTAALVAALLFAVSPMLVTLGSEARGYAPMALALLVALLFVHRTLAGEERYHRPEALAFCFTFGALCQLTMVFGVLALCGWAFVTWWVRDTFGQAVRKSVALFAVPLLALALVLGLVVGAGWASKTGFQFGSYEPFTLLLFLKALVGLVGYTIGLPIDTLLLPVAALALLVLAPRFGVSRIAFYRLAIFAFPAMLALLRSGNPGYPRYYLLAGIALLLLIGEAVARSLAQPGRLRWIGAAVLCVITAGSLIQDVDLAINRRGDPAAAVRTLARLVPDGSTVLLDRPSGSAMLVVAAAQAHYPLRLTTAACPVKNFVFVDRFSGQPGPIRVRHCGRSYRPVAGARAHGLSGTHWTLYRRAS